ncbi:hypothetical protein JRQ81_009348 [Phrynocephalus forsythii]|uniref:Uncharacterized protein n=1 Tax=Phrynocephalus forsythii TaxID=171643 RepID=A0A9Q1ASG5_9SAUR|nr:hypothetical protein JRQ81_009348 [Phrynocephalus forsythii]
MAGYQKLKKPKGRRTKAPNTTLKHALSACLPWCCVRFLWSYPEEFWPAKFFLGAGLSRLLIFPMSLTEDHKIKLMGGFVGVTALGWAVSPHFRCASLLVVPKFLGKEGRIYVLTYVLTTIYDGPVANIRHNLAEVVRSISCTVELQIENAKRSWKVSTAPLRKILKDMVRSGQTLRSETREVGGAFAQLNAQVASEAGYGGRSVREAVRKANPSTQEVYEAKTRRRCGYIIEQAVRRCQAWFETKYQSCLRTIAVPLISHLLCIPMKFSFLCHLAKLMHTWCRDKIPVEGNFGQTYDRVNGSVDNLNQDFTASLVIKEEHQSMLIGADISSHKHLVDDVNEEIAEKSQQLGTAMSVFRVLLSCTFVFVFASAYSYTNKYNQDIRFDNLYISHYFRQIDARRRKQNKRTLLPLRRAEQTQVIDPLYFSFQPPETKTMMGELLGCVPALLFLLIACALDFLLFTVFSTIRHHSFVEYSFRSSHHLEVKVGGNTMMARLLRSTIGAFNTSSETVMEATNLQCLPEPQGMDRRQYLACALPLGALVLLCVLQVYVFRLRRVIAAFYFPKREKKRTLFLYNEMLRQRLAFVEVQRKRIILRARRCRRLEREGFPAHLAILLEVEGEPLALDLLQNRELLARDRVLIYYLPNGTRATRPSGGTESNCCYRGDIQGYRGSWASVCVCSGLRGLLTLSKGRRYTLESGEAGTTRVYRLDSMKQETGGCRVLPPEQLDPQVESGQAFLRRAKRDAELEAGCVELVMVADQAEFKLDPDLEQIQIRMSEIANYMDGFYQTLGLRVALVGVEIWNDRDRVPVDGSPQEVLERFLRWRQTDLLPRMPHDSVQLIMGSPFTGGTLGASTQGSICSYRSAGISMECSDPCCDATTCRLRPGAQCAMGGACCHECKLRGAGFPCRPTRNECDLPEYCDGVSPRCPANVHKQDGMSCEGEKAICYGGTCPTYGNQCQDLWGPGSVPVSDACVASLNRRGDPDGNCGRQANGSFISCARSDVRCGQLQCQGNGTSVRKQNRRSREPGCLHKTPASADDVLEPALVLPGTPCGPNKICMEKKCQDLSSLKLPACQCNGHGVCNNKGHCHCEPGWAPPDCQSSGAGGSVDSGPATKEQGSGASTALVLTSLLLLLVFALGLYCAKKLGLYKRLWQFGKGTSCQYRITQPEPQSYSRAPPERPRPPQWRQTTELQQMPISKPTPSGATRPDPPSKPLPPDPVPKGRQALLQDRPAPPSRPLPADPVPKYAQTTGPAKPPPPRKPLPSDPTRAEAWAASCYDPIVQMLPSRPAPPPPPHDDWVFDTHPRNLIWVNRRPKT